jgi:hypothetical protein
VSRELFRNVSTNRPTQAFLSDYDFVDAFADQKRLDAAAACFYFRKLRHAA